MLVKRLFDELRGFYFRNIFKDGSCNFSTESISLEEHNALFKIFQNQYIEKYELIKVCDIVIKLYSTKSYVTNNEKIFVMMLGDIYSFLLEQDVEKSIIPLINDYKEYYKKINKQLVYFFAKYKNSSASFDTLRRLILLDEYYVFGDFSYKLVYGTIDKLSFIINISANDLLDRFEKYDSFDVFKYRYNSKKNVVYLKIKDSKIRYKIYPVVNLDVKSFKDIEMNDFTINSFIFNIENCQDDENEYLFDNYLALLDLKDQKLRCIDREQLIKNDTNNILDYFRLAKSCKVLEKDKAFFKKAFKSNYDKFKREDMLQLVESLIIN